MDTTLNIDKDTVPREKHILIPIQEPTSRPLFIDVAVATHLPLTVDFIMTHLPLLFLATHSPLPLLFVATCLPFRSSSTHCNLFHTSSSSTHSNLFKSWDSYGCCTCLDAGLVPSFIPSFNNGYLMIDSFLLATGLCLDCNWTRSPLPLLVITNTCHFLFLLLQLVNFFLFFSSQLFCHFLFSSSLQLLCFLYFLLPLVCHFLFLFFLSQLICCFLFYSSRLVCHFLFFYSS